MDTDINILAGCFVIIMIRRGVGKKAHNVVKMRRNEKREKKERENEGWHVQLGGGEIGAGAEGGYPSN